MNLGQKHTQMFLKRTAPVEEIAPMSQILDRCLEVLYPAHGPNSFYILSQHLPHNPGGNNGAVNIIVAEEEMTPVNIDNEKAIKISKLGQSCERTQEKINTIVHSFNN